jgi:acyl transferase domain-containing protein/NAD(P)-dependent dehydrogenase (short-subunit alcohol dehydrogenase family)
MLLAVNTTEKRCPVAIVGMSCFFPRSPGLKAFWRLLVQGQDAITDVPATHWSKQDYFDPDPRTPDHVYCARGGFIPAIDFDPSEFGIPPSSLEATDTSQLLALAAAKQALRDAGLSYNPTRTSVILGVTGTQELVIPLSARLGFPKWRQALQEEGIEGERCEQIIRRIGDSYVAWQENSFPGLLGNVVAGRICNRLDLGGTNCVVDAACASSLAAVHLALLELVSGRSDTVITGGVDTLNDIFMHMCFAKTQILSPTGDARPFSKDADGTVLGEGLGLVVLKRLPDAERDGDRIYAVIQGIGSASDGRSQSIYAPRIEGQLQTLRAAYTDAGIDPASVGLIEAHGTGTRVGDKVEFSALCEIMGTSSAGGRRCALGSVKSMIGHTKAAAGAAGLIKVALALYHKVFPPTLKADTPDPALGLETSPFYLNTRTRPWLSTGGQPRRAGVSAFGFGGSNFHLVLEEHRPQKPCIAWDDSVHIVGFSAERRSDLLESMAAFVKELERPASNVSWTRAAAQSRRRFDSRQALRLVVVAEHADQALSALRKAAERLQSSPPQDGFELPDCFFGSSSIPGRIGFLFPGQGSQYTGMGCSLVGWFPSAMRVIQQAQDIVPSQPPLGDLIYPPAGLGTESAEQALRSTDKAQPAIGAVSLALLRVLEEFEVTPEAVAGHSFGELTALCAAGWITEAEFFTLAAARGRAMAQTESGAMLAVRAPLGELEALMRRLSLPLVLANRNSPDQGVLSGPSAAIAEASVACRKSGFAVAELAVDGAFHSPLMRNAHALFIKTLDAVRLTPQATAVFSNHTAQPYPHQSEDAGRILAAHMLQPVDFVGEIEAMYRAGVRTFLEVGPRSVLTKLVTAILKNRPFQAFALDASNGRGSEIVDFAKALSRLAALGYPVRLEKWESPEPPAEDYRMRVALTGANFRAAAAGLRSAPRPVATPVTDKTDQTTPETIRSGPPAAFSRAARLGQLSPNSEDAMTRNDNDQRIPATEALRSVQEGLKAIQTIQLQTAQAHQKFLETQSEATRVLLELVRSTSRLTEPVDYLRPAAPVPVAPLPVASAPPPEAIGAPTAAAPSAPISFEPIEAATAAISTPPSGLSGLETTLLAVVSDLTGYPVEMLGLEMDIEADLGIDSIKRVEILSTLEEKLPGLPAVAPEDMPRLKTLAQIIAHFTGSLPATKTAPSAPSLTTEIAAGNPGPESHRPDPVEHTAADQSPVSDERLAPRRVVTLKPQPACASAMIAIPTGRKVFITDDRTGLSQAVMAELGNLGVGAVLVSADILKFRKDLPPAAGLLIIQHPGSKTVENDLKNAFELTCGLAKDLLESARIQTAFFATVTRMDGACGFGGQLVADPIQGALAGLAKTAAAEWPEVICHALDLAPGWKDMRAAAKALVCEIACRGPVEIGLTETARHTPDLVLQDYPDGDITLQEGDAVVISGGGRGITAVCAIELARRLKPTVIILGRTPEPAPEPEWMRELTSESEIKKMLLQTEFSDITAKPTDVERRFKQLLSSREVTRTLQAIHATGAAVAYYPVDVRDAAQVQAALADARSRFGPIRGVIHGAGVLEDRLIVDKSLEQFERVFDTKLKGFQALLNALAEDELKALVIFSSVTARFGNKGQADYAMANEALNKLAWAEARRRPGCRIVSINWGPWECGMVTPSIKREFERQGVDLLAASEGARSLLRELGRPADAPAEVVIGGMLKPIGDEAVSEVPQPSLSMLFERQIGLANHPVLHSHIIDGKPVVPMALLAEWLGHGALHENPGLLLHGLEDLRILSGIRLQSESLMIRVLAGKPRPTNGFYEVDLEVRNGRNEGKDILHCRARAILTETYARPPSYRLSAALSCNHYPRSTADVYEKILFHGHHLQGLRRIQCCTPAGMLAEVSGAPEPSQWITAPLRHSWLCDPLVLDSAFQMASLWCYEQHGCVSLPSHAASYRQFRSAFPAAGVTVALEVREATAKKMRGDFTFLDPNGEVIARMIGFEAVMDPLLNRAFKPESGAN